MSKEVTLEVYHREGDNVNEQLSIAIGKITYVDNVQRDEEGHNQLINKLKALLADECDVPYNSIRTGEELVVEEYNVIINQHKEILSDLEVEFNHYMNENGTGASVPSELIKRLKSVKADIEHLESLKKLATASHSTDTLSQRCLDVIEAWYETENPPKETIDDLINEFKQIAEYINSTEGVEYPSQWHKARHAIRWFIAGETVILTETLAGTIFNRYGEEYVVKSSEQKLPATFDSDVKNNLTFHGISDRWMNTPNRFMEEEQFENFTRLKYKHNE